MPPLAVCNSLLQFVSQTNQNLGSPTTTSMFDSEPLVRTKGRNDTLVAFAVAHCTNKPSGLNMKSYGLTDIYSLDSVVILCGLTGNTGVETGRTLSALYHSLFNEELLYRVESKRITPSFTLKSLPRRPANQEYPPQLHSLVQIWSLLVPKNKMEPDLMFQNDWWLIQCILFSF